jgi:peroxin-4
MRFTSRIWHPNVSWKVGLIAELCDNCISLTQGTKTGEICLDVLGSQWSPVWTLSSALTAVIALLDSPEPDSPLNVDAGEYYPLLDGDSKLFLMTFLQLPSIGHKIDLHISQCVG